MSDARTNLILDLSELAGLYEHTHTLEEFLQTAINLTAYKMKAAVCSLYIYDKKRDELVMVANQGLKNAVGQVKLSSGEGLSGTALKEQRTVRVGRIGEEESNRLFPGIDEEKYQAFLAVPIIKGLDRIGVLVVQDPQPDYFTAGHEKILRGIASQLSNTIESAQLLLEMHREKEPATTDEIGTELHFIKGVAGTQGFAMGKSIVLDHRDYDILIPAADDEEDTLEDFQKALRTTEEQLINLQEEIEKEREDVASQIFSAHLLMLMDFAPSIEAEINKGKSPQRAIANVVNNYIHIWASSENIRFRENVQDLKDLGHRLMHNMSGNADESADYEGCIIIVDNVLPSELLKLVAQRAQGLIVTQGHAASHIAVLSRSLRLPVVFTDRRVLLTTIEDTPVILDAAQATIFLNPTDEITKKYRELRDTSEIQIDESEIRPETLTRDGTRINIHANINLLSDIDTANRMKAEGIGLYRSEFPFIVRANFPSEEEQFRIYQRIVEKMPGKDIVLRTLDIGGDKALPYHSHDEANPFLGLRAIRFSLKNKPIFCQQLRGMLRANSPKIMFPFISSLDDFLEAKEITLECRQDLIAEGLKIPMPKIGAMIELPAAVEIAEELARACDFFCLGTNDLIQYMLAVDRTNENVSDYYLAYHPAVLRALKKVADAASKFDLDISVCGDLAHDVTMLPFIIGIGIKKISVEPRAILRVQQAINNMHVGDCYTTASKLLSMGSIREIRAYLETTQK